LVQESSSQPGLLKRDFASTIIPQHRKNRHDSWALRLSTWICPSVYKQIDHRGGALGARAVANSPTKRTAFSPQTSQRVGSMPVRFWSRSRQSVFGGFGRDGGPGSTSRRPHWRRIQPKGRDRHVPRREGALDRGGVGSCRLYPNL